VRRVVVTGLGAVTPLGPTLEATRAAWERGDVAARPATLFDASGFAETRSAEVPGFEPRAHFRVPKALKLTDRKTGFAVAAAGMALSRAGFPEEAREALGVVLGTSGSDLQEKELARAFRRAPEPFEASDVPRFASAVLQGLNPLWLLVGLPNMTSAHVAIQLGARGPNSTVMTDWVAGLQAIAEGADWVRAGECDAVLAGGADSGLHPLAYAALEQAGRFGGPDGLVPGEGAAVLLLEARDRALARGATVVGEVIASGSGPDPAALRSRVLAEAGWTEASVSSTDGRELERRAGHLLGASGALQLVLALAGGGASILASSLGPSGTAVAVAVAAAGGVVPSREDGAVGHQEDAWIEKS